jgi:hypothetical protein
MKKTILLLLLTSTILEMKGQDTRIGIELPISITNTSIDLPRLLTGQIPAVEGGQGIDIGLGLTYENSNNLNLRGGFHFWNVPFKPTVNVRNNNDDDYVIEDGVLSYYGVYLRAEYGTKFFFIGGGFDFSFANSYKTDREYYENNQLIGSEKNLDSSVLTDEFSNLFNIVANIGFKLPLHENLILKPYLSVGASFGSIYPTDKVTDIVNTPYLRVYYDEPQTIDLQYIPIVGYGISFEYKL